MKKSIIKKKLLTFGLISAFLATGISTSMAQAATGTWKQDTKGWWYLYSGGSYAKNAWVKDGGKWYYCDGSGYMVTGWKKISGKWYYFNKSGVVHTGWKKISGKWYYFNKSGVMQTGWKQLDEKWYFFADGAMATGWKKISKKWYYFGTTGTMVTGNVDIYGTKYYFSSKGVWIEKPENLYYMDYLDYDEEGKARFYRFTESVTDNIGNVYDDAFSLYVRESNGYWTYYNESGKAYREYYINGQYNRFEGVFALQKNTVYSAQEQYLNVYADNALVYHSPALLKGGLPIHFSIDISKAKRLKVEYYWKDVTTEEYCQTHYDSFALMGDAFLFNE